MPTDYGSGISLDEYFDIDIDRQTGDIATISGESEVKKDIAFNLGRALKHGDGIETPESLQSGLFGKRITTGILTDTEMAVSKIILVDPRVDSVEFVKAEQGDGYNEVQIQSRAFLTGTDETIEFNFVVSTQ